ncbi:replicative DNA helicase [Candidatus Wirthbacteria bacterium CG2_30_54_11]|uniref:Replicative DNA helicase n=1 Tax=Candidatus Wirthbacteria bacterium CG2_30_54_11 TaxID=1817892 RepID=A0A1J5IEV6_9BACT|nr:MAG: replicative DNA helicase [Candidatus Wirthbacteria bacterium CG2_30_54_11]
MPDFKLPPQNLEAEESVLGSLLLDKNAILKTIEILRSEDFYSEINGIIYASIVDLFEKRVPTDLVTLTESLGKQKKLKLVGGASYLSALVNKVPAAIHVEYYANIVRQKSILRKMIEGAERIAEIAYDEEREIAESLDEAEQLIFNIAQKNIRSDFSEIKEILSDTFDRIDELHKNKGALSGVATGFIDLDQMLGGMQRSDLIILAARPSMGKTSLVLNIAQNVATKMHVPVGIFSLEMSKEQLVDRMLCSEADIDLRRLRTGFLKEEDFSRIGDAMGVLGEAPLYIDDTPGINILEMRAKARRLQAEVGLGLIVVDYLQLMSGYSRRQENRVQEISEISRALKGLGRELNVPVLACSQLSRAVETRNPKIPQLSDLRESGSIEQDADVVLFIYREDYYNPDTGRQNIADILIAKHRNGPTGKIELVFKKEQTKFGNLARGS